MEADTLIPAADEFVLRIVGDPAGTLGRARSLGDVEALGAEPRLFLLRTKGTSSAKASWEATAQALGGEAPLLPVLYDRGGLPHYPTGEITVRFVDAPSDSELRAFCEAEGLELLRRNEFVAQQVVCAPSSAPHAFLPDVVARLASRPGVHRAWANTVSHYRRVEDQLPPPGPSAP